MTQIPRETLANTLTTWLVRIGLVGIILYGIQAWFGPFDFLWWAWPVYAVFSLAASLRMAKIRNDQADRLEQVIQQAQGGKE